MRILLSSLVLVAPFTLFACEGRPPEVVAVPVAAVGNPYDESDCNLQTKLVEGIPGSPGHLVASTRNPNGDSELALLMRRFVDDLRTVRPQLEAGQPVEKLWPIHHRMRCAWPTRPEERTEQYDLRAQGYLLAVRAFDEAPGRDTYNGIIAGCIACHSVSCGGPIEFIGSMKWE